jgi:NagD protein
MRTPAQCWLTDMDGVLVHEDHALPGAAEFLQRLTDRQRRFLVLTNDVFRRVHALITGPATVR